MLLQTAKVISGQTAREERIFISSSVRAFEVGSVLYHRKETSLKQKTIKRKQKKKREGAGGYYVDVTTSVGRAIVERRAIGT
jgi:hypothetical protein